jgi:hypothetical protein
MEDTGSEIGCATTQELQELEKRKKEKKKEFGKQKKVCTLHYFQE